MRLLVTPHSNLGPLRKNLEAPLGNLVRPNFPAVPPCVRNNLGFCQEPGFRGTYRYSLYLCTINSCSLWKRKQHQWTV